MAASCNSPFFHNISCINKRFYSNGVCRLVELLLSSMKKELEDVLRFFYYIVFFLPLTLSTGPKHHEVVADLIQTSFLFSIPTDGPMSFTTPRVSVQWILRFEFLITPKDVHLSRYEHPLLIREREKCEWVLPITVHAPPPRTSSAAQNRGDTLFGLEPSWVRS
ncbi:hypothetical protein YC2023_075490 [Brassica napus]